MSAKRPRVGAAEQTCVGWKPAALLLTCALTLAACTSAPKRPVIAPQPSTPPRTTVVKPPASPVAPPVVAPVTPETDKDAAKDALARNSNDSVASGEVGYYMDVLHGRLKQLASKNVGVGRQGNLIVLVLTGTAGFEPAAVELNPALRATLAELSRVLVEYRKTLVTVRVRGDDAGAKTSNPQLAGQRGAAVATYLVEAGVADKRVLTAGSAPTRAPAARAQTKNNLRVELQLEPVVRARTGGR